MDIIKTIHVSCALFSILGFVTRWGLMMFNSPKLQSKIVKRLPHIIDTLLLVSAIAMLVNLGLVPWEMSWLMAKLIALLLYIGLGFVALRLGPNKRIRTAAGITAILVFMYIVNVAITKAPFIF